MCLSLISLALTEKRKRTATSDTRRRAAGEVQPEELGLLSGVSHRIVVFNIGVLLLKMAAFGMVQMLIEAAEFLDRRERGKQSDNVGEGVYALAQYAFHTQTIKVNRHCVAKNNNAFTYQLHAHAAIKHECMDIKAVSDG